MGYAIWTGTILKNWDKTKSAEHLIQSALRFSASCAIVAGVILAGLVHCAHCGARMSGFIHCDRYKKKDGTVVENRKPKYNCFQRAQRLRDCDGQALYLADRVDGIVLPPVPGPDETRKMPQITQAKMESRNIALKWSKQNLILEIRCIWSDILKESYRFSA